MNKIYEMKRILLLLFLVLLENNFSIIMAKNFDVQPRNWWINMKNTELQVLVHHKDIANYAVSLQDNRKVELIRRVLTGNPNYQILYFNINDAPAQVFKIIFTKKSQSIEINYELKKREVIRKQKSFDASDVVYLLMPDRFANGSYENDKIKGMLDQSLDISDPNARHGGDLQGMMDHLDYLKQLGITTIWPTPLLANDMSSHSYHGYAITDYYQIDPRYGTNEDYKLFVERAHKQGLKVIQDMVFNHCGDQNFLFKDMPSISWFNNKGKFIPTSHKISTIFDSHVISSDKKAFDNGWFVESMPDLNEKNPDVATYLIQNSIWWIEYAKIDGIRQDTYPYNDFKMMQDWCLRIEQEYPGFNIVGESWMGNNVGISMWQKNSKLATSNTYLPCVMDFPLMQLLNEVFNDEDNTEGINKLYDYFSQDAVYTDPLNLLVFLDNHDTSRFTKNKEDKANVDRYKMALTLLLTTRGIPQLYYGDEIAMFAEKSQGDGMIRQNFPGGWKGDKVNAFTGEGLDAIQKEYFSFAVRLLNWRKGNDIIAKGSLKHYVPKNGVYVYVRQYKRKKVIVFINGSNNDRVLNPLDYSEVLPKKQFKDIISNEWIDLAKPYKMKSHEIRIIEA